MVTVGKAPIQPPRLDHWRLGLVSWTGDMRGFVRAVSPVSTAIVWRTRDGAAIRQEMDELQDRTAPAQGTSTKTGFDQAKV